MCESCVDRIFSHGPAQCPIPGCRRTLRKPRFREQTFEDIRVEREVDIRRRVAAVFNKREQDFEDLRSYNDYLNEVEDITFNLVNQVDVEATEKKFAAYERANQEEILENERLEREERMGFAQAMKVEKQLARERREQARRELESERREAEEGKRDVLHRLASGQDPEGAVRQGQQVQLKKRLDRQQAADRTRLLQEADQLTAPATTPATSTAPTNPLIRGLKARPKPAEPGKPIDPFGGLRFAPKYFSLQEEYLWDGIQAAKKDDLVVAGGYDVRDFAWRSLGAAFEGLGLAIGDEGEVGGGGGMEGVVAT
jgi:CDK-activating kinase assembly factor MAT1